MSSRFLVLALVAGFASVACRTYAADGNPGREAYFRYCSSCHGADGRGDGVVARTMRPKPPDLTQLAKEHDGTFPAKQVRDSIDGRRRIAAHGSTKMPVWGTIFGAQPAPEGPDAHARSQVQIITDYLSSIQTP